MEVGDRFNKLILVSKLKGGRAAWNVVCDCGAKLVRREDHLKSGRSKSCKSCSAKETANKYGMPTRSEHVGDLGKTYYSSLKSSAYRRGLSFNVSQEFLWTMLVAQDFKCTLSGLDINLSIKILKGNPNYSLFTASLDRISSEAGYEEDNVQWVHKDYNRLKNNYSQETFIKMCQLVSSHANQQPSLGRDFLEGSTTNHRD